MYRMIDRIRLISNKNQDISKINCNDLVSYFNCYAAAAASSSVKFELFEFKKEKCKQQYFIEDHFPGIRLFTLILFFA